MKTLKDISLVVLLLLAIPAVSQTSDTKTTPDNGSQQTAKSKSAHTSQPRDGQQVFDQNCSRCHTTPQGFPPSISGTVARHMRVRAGLSKEDEQALLRFLNP
jgi:mono/diheme cytochrome c family protein